jgi:pimeloyl-ACP methyl ester carboxylesterase
LVLAGKKARAMSGLRIELERYRGRASRLHGVLCLCLDNRRRGHWPGCFNHAIDEANHAVFVDQPERFDEALKGFLAGLGH